MRELGKNHSLSSKWPFHEIRKKEHSWKRKLEWKNYHHYFTRLLAKRACSVIGDSLGVWKLLQHTNHLVVPFKPYLAKKEAWLKTTTTTLYLLLVLEFGASWRWNVPLCTAHLWSLSSAFCCIICTRLWKLIWLCNDSRWYHGGSYSVTVRTLSRKHIRCSVYIYILRFLCVTCGRSKHSFCLFRLLHDG